MAALENSILSADTITALDAEWNHNFDQELDQLQQVLGIFAPEVMTAGTALYRRKITGALNDAAVAEGDIVPLSHYKTDKTAIGAVDIKPYATFTSLQAMNAQGVAAALRTDGKFMKDIRSGILANFYSALASASTGTATGTTLQAVLAQADAKLGATMEDNADSADRVIHFVNTYDIADYLATATVTVQTLFGMQYLADFLGVQNIVMTNKVAKGTVIVTPAENIHVYAADLNAASTGELVYAVSESGVIGVAHKADYDRVGVRTNVVTGMRIEPEITDYIVKGTIAPSA